MKIFLYFTTFLALASCHGNVGEEYTDTSVSSYLADMWVEGADVLRILWRDCSKKLLDLKDKDAKEYFPKFVRCMKRKTLRALDRSLSTDIVPITDGVNLVRYELVDRQGKVVENSENETTFSSWTEKELEDGDWRTLALRRMAKVLRTHVIKLDFGEENLPEKAEFRHRRRHQMMTMMMFGIVSIGMVVIPMGFQFLAVLGGKALLLAKMALILASIQGLKKIAASPVNYGFYQYPHYDHIEKRSHDDWPEPATFPGTPPPALPKQNHWMSADTSNIKFDRTNFADNTKLGEIINFKHAGKEVIKSAKPSVDIVTWKPEFKKSFLKSAEPKLYPVYAKSSESAPSDFYSAFDVPAHLTDLTTKPGEVQADLTLDLPFNKMLFQDPTTVLSA